MDKEFLDPAECYYVYGQPPPSPQKHSGYWADPRVWSMINGVAAGLADGPPPPPPPGNGPPGGGEQSVSSPERIQELVQTPEADPAELAQLAAELPVSLDRSGETVEVMTAEGPVTVDGDDG